MKFKRMVALLLIVATMFTLVSAEVYAVDVTFTVKSADGSTTLLSATVESGTTLTITSTGLELGTGETYTYNGDLEFIGFSTSANATKCMYAPGYATFIASSMILYVVEDVDLGVTVVGDPVEGAEEYELWEIDKEIEFDETCPYYLMGEVYYEIFYNSAVQRSGTFYYCIASSISDFNVDYQFMKPTGGSYFLKYRISYSKLLYGENSNIFFQYATSSTLDGAISACQKATVETFNGVASDTTESIEFKEIGTGYGSMPSLSSGSYKNVLYADGITCGSEYIDIPYAVGDELIATSGEINFDLGTYNFNGDSHKLAVKATGNGYYDSDFSNEVVYKATARYALTVNASNAVVTDIDGDTAPTGVFENRPLSIKITPVSGYDYPDALTVTMGNSDLSLGSGYYFDTTTGNLVIPAVTGMVVISCDCVARAAAPVIARDIDAETNAYPIVLTFNAVANASGYSVYIDNTVTTAVETTETDGVVTVKIKAEAFSKSASYTVHVIAEPVDGYVASRASNTVVKTVAVQIATPVATAAPDLRTEEYPFVCKVTKPDHAVSLTAYLNGNHCGALVYETDENGDWIVYVPTTVFDGSGDYEIYFVAIGESTDYVESESSNRLTFSITKLATPVIWLE